MHADWSAECTHDDPVLVVPWALDPDDPASASAAPFVDLRENPYDLDQVPEAEQHPALLHALRALNAPRSPVFSAKCDAWPLDDQEREALRLDLDLAPEESTHGFASYLDLLWRDRALFASAHQQETRLERLARLAAPIDARYAALECILRPAILDFTGPQEGFASTLYVKALGTDPPHAHENWSRALEAVTALLRSRDFSAS